MRLPANPAIKNYHLLEYRTGIPGYPAVNLKMSKKLIFFKK
jgi:hypothetical protein